MEPGTARFQYFRVIGDIVQRLQQFDDYAADAPERGAQLSAVTVYHVGLREPDLHYRPFFARRVVCRA
jgi:hypothetical protein